MELDKGEDITLI